MSIETPPSKPKPTNIEEQIEAVKDVIGPDQERDSGFREAGLESGGPLVQEISSTFSAEQRPDNTLEIKFRYRGNEISRIVPQGNERLLMYKLDGEDMTGGTNAEFEKKFGASIKYLLYSREMSRGRAEVLGAKIKNILAD